MRIPIHKAEGIIIGRYNSNEFDRFLIVYTKEFGKIIVKARSLRKKEAKLKETLELFNHASLLIAKGKNIEHIAGAVIINSFPFLKSNVQSLAAAYYLSEIMDKLIVAPEKDYRIWQLILKALIFLNEKKRNAQTIKKLIERFEYNFISYLGYRGQKTEKQQLKFIQGLCGAPINSFQFLQKVIQY